MKTKHVTIQQAFNLFKMLQDKQKRRKAWLGPSGIYSMRIDELQRNARLCLKQEQSLNANEITMLKAIESEGKNVFQN